MSYTSRKISKKRSPILSIITINYNNVEGLRQTIESVVCQTCEMYEYIIIDGGSNDGSIQVIEHYKSKINYWVSEPDNGIYQAMNKGIRAATGQYCQFLNSGDRLVSRFVIDKMLNNIPECSVLLGNMLKVSPSGVIRQDKGIVGKTCQQPTLLTFYMGTLNHSCALIKRSLFYKYGFYDESLSIVSDWKFYLVAIGLNNELVAYRDIDVTFFDMTGVSSIHPDLEKQERRSVLKELIPNGILEDYDSNYYAIQQMTRIKRYKTIYFCLNVIERLLFKYEYWRINR